MNETHSGYRRSGSQKLSSSVFSLPYRQFLAVLLIVTSVAAFHLSSKLSWVLFVQLMMQFVDHGPGLFQGLSVCRRDPVYPSSPPGYVPQIRLEGSVATFRRRQIIACPTRMFRLQIEEMVDELDLSRQIISCHPSNPPSGLCGLLRTQRQRSCEKNLDQNRSEFISKKIASRCPINVRGGIGIHFPSILKLRKSSQAGFFTASRPLCDRR
jgi:hypothetical protein